MEIIMKRNIQNIILIFSTFLLFSTFVYGQAIKDVKGILNFSAKITKKDVKPSEFGFIGNIADAALNNFNACVNVTAKIVYYADNQIAPIGGQEVSIIRDQCKWQ